MTYTRDREPGSCFGDMIFVASDRCTTVSSDNITADAEVAKKLDDMESADDWRDIVIAHKFGDVDEIDVILEVRPPLQRIWVGWVRCVNCEHRWTGTTPGHAWQRHPTWVPCSECGKLSGVYEFSNHIVFHAPDEAGG